MKVLDPKKLWNFVDYNIFIWICLGPQTIIFCFFCFFVLNYDFWNWAKILLLAQTAQSSITLAKLAGPYISSHLDIDIYIYIYMLLLLNIRIDICIRPSPNPNRNMKTNIIWVISVRIRSVFIPNHHHEFVIRGRWNYALCHKVANGLHGVAETERKHCRGAPCRVFRRDGEW